MAAALWKSITPYFFILIALPCMGMFPSRFQGRRRNLALALALPMTCAAKGLLLILQIQLFGRQTYLGTQFIFLVCIAVACLILYKGNPFSMLLIILLCLSLAVQLGFVAGGLMEYFYGAGYPLWLVALRDVLGYGSFALFYLFLRLRVNLTSLYLSTADHLILLSLAFMNYLFTCLYATFVLPSEAASIPFNLASLFTTVSVTYLILRFTAEHTKAQEQQLLIGEMRLADNTLTQIQESLSQMRELRHELSNYAVYARELLHKGDTKALEGLLSSLGQAVALPSDVVSTSSPVVNAILNQKNAYARSLGIQTQMQVSIPVDLPIDDLTLCSLFGNLLNNAIEACQGQASPWVRLSCGPVKSYLAIEVENSVQRDIILENPNLTTTKEDFESHGMGIRILRRIAEKYNGILHYEMRGKDCFCVQLLLNLEKA